MEKGKRPESLDDKSSTILIKGEFEKRLVASSLVSVEACNQQMITDAFRGRDDGMGWLQVQGGEVGVSKRCAGVQGSEDRPRIVAAGGATMSSSNLSYSKTG